MIPNMIASQRLASKIGIQQSKQLAQADAVGRTVDKRVLRNWYAVLKILKEYEQTKRIDPTAQRRIAELLHGMTAESIKGVAAGLTKLAKDAHKATVGEVISEAPRSVLTLALQQRPDTQPFTEAKLTPEQQAQVKAQLFNPLSDQATSQIVFAPSATTSWQARIAAQTKLAPPDQVAALVIQGMAAGQTVQQLAKSMEPAVQGVRSSAQRVARTEGMRVAHAARLSAFDDLGDMVIGYQIHATMDWRVRPHHAARNGNIYYKNPGAGQLSVAEMPQPPIEEDGTVAFNCRCYLTPVFDADPAIENDPALKALFTDNDKKLVADPVVYSEWFNNATEQERKWAVGVRRLATAQKKLLPGEQLTWANVLDPVTGQLIPTDKLEGETDADRQARIDQVNEVIDRRRDLAVQISRFGYIQDPNPPTPPPPPPDQPAAVLAPEQPAAVPPPPPLPLPDYITDVDALMAKLGDKKYTNQIYKNLLVHDGQPLISKHYWMQYKSGKLSARSLANIYNKNLAKLKGDQPPDKFTKQVAKIIPPPRRVVITTVSKGDWIQGPFSYWYITSIQGVGPDKTVHYNTFGHKTGEPLATGEAPLSDLEYQIDQGMSKKLPGQPQIVTDYFTGSTNPAAATPTPVTPQQDAAAKGQWFKKGSYYWVISDIEYPKTPNDLKTFIYKSYHAKGSMVGEFFTAGVMDEDDITSMLLNGDLERLPDEPQAVTNYLNKSAAPAVPVLAPAATPKAVPVHYTGANSVDNVQLGTWVETNNVYAVLSVDDGIQLQFTAYDKKTGAQKGPWFSSYDAMDQGLMGGSYKILSGQPEITKPKPPPSIAVDTWWETQQLYYYIAAINGKDVVASTFNKSDGSKAAPQVADLATVQDSITKGLFKQLAAAPNLNNGYSIGDWFQITGADDVFFKIISISSTEVVAEKYSQSGNLSNSPSMTKSTFEYAIANGINVLVPPPVWAAPMKTATPSLPWRDALQQAKQEDPHAGVWGPSIGQGTSYGGIVFDDEGRVMLRKPTGNFDGYHWTWPKGKPSSGDHPADAAVREVEEETGHKGSIVGYLPGGFSSSSSSKTHFYMMKSAKHNPSKMDAETAEVQWVTLEEAEKLINETTKPTGKERDLQILAAVKKHLQELSAGKPLPNAKDAAPPPPAPIKPKPVTPPPKAPVKVAPPPPDLHNTARWNTPIGPNGRKPAVGLLPVNGERQAYKPTLPTLPKPTKPITHKVKFPSQADKKKLSYVQGLGGGTGAELVADSMNTRYVRKKGANPDHLREEVAADKLYAACGVRVPAVELHEEDGKPVKLAEFVTGKTLRDYLSSANATDKKNVLKKIQQSFAADALLGNWDVAGANFDNVMIDAQGEPIRIDNGGSLRYRALGTPKGKDWNAHPTELWSLTDEKLGKNPQTAEMFKGMKWSDTVEQMEKLIAGKDQILKAAPDDETREMLGRRIEQFEDIAATSRLMLADGWSEEYVKELTKHQQYFRQNGMVGKLPNRLGDLEGTLDRDTRNTLVDEKGEEMDELRGNGRTKDLIEYITRNGGNWEMIRSYASSQAGDSWNSDQLSMGMKALLLDYRPKAKHSDFYWKRSYDESKQGKDKLLSSTRTSEASAMTTVAATHAFNQEIMRNIDMPNNNRANGTFRVYRTENSDVTPLMTDPKTGAPINMPTTSKKPIRHSLKRGALESYSAMSPIEVCGDRLTVLEVPYHRVIMSYFLSKSISPDDRFFLGDRENEVVAMTDGIDADYHGKGYSR